MSNRTEINQANSQHSTGPKTEAGKQRSCLNALTHGLTGQLVVMPNEDLQAYQHHLKSFTDEYQPKGATESQLVQALADVSWRLNRVAALETNLLTLTASPVDLISTLEAQSRALANLSLHSQRLSRQFEKTLAQLRDLQKIRHSQEGQDLNALLEITEMYEEKGETYNPKEDGFVFTQSQINQAILAACGNSRETCDLANVSDVYTAWPWERARNGSDRKISGSSVARSWARRRMHFTIG